MWDLLREEYTCTAVEFSTVEEGFGQQVSREFLGFKSGFSTVRIRVERANGLFHVLVDIGVVFAIVLLYRRRRICE